MSEYSVTDLGAVTAYAQAVENGYTGTLEQWAMLQINAVNNYNELFNQIYIKDSSAALWEQGGLSSTTGATSSSTVRVRTTDYLPDSVAKIVMNTGYYIIVYAYAQDGTFAGMLKNNYDFTSENQQTEFIVDVSTTTAFAAVCITGSFDLRALKNFRKNNGDDAYKYKIVGAYGAQGTTQISPDNVSITPVGNITFYENNVGHAVDNDLIGIGENEPDSDRAVLWIDQESATSVQVPQIDDDHVSDVDTWSSEKINSELGQLFNYVDGTEVASWESGYIKNNEETVDLTSVVPSPSGYKFVYAVFDCSEGDVFTIVGLGASAARLWSFIDSNNNVLSAAAAHARLSNGQVVAPANAVKLIVDCNITNDTAVAFKGYGTSYHINELVGATRTVGDTDLAANGRRGDTTINGVTFTWNKDKTACTLNGTNSNSATVYYFSGGVNTALPKGIVAGETYKVSVKTTNENIRFGAYLFKNGTYSGARLFTEDGILLVPYDTTGLRFVIYVVASATANNDVISDISVCKNDFNSIEKKIANVKENIIDGGCGVYEIEHEFLPQTGCSYDVENFFYYDTNRKTTKLQEMPKDGFYVYTTKSRPFRITFLKKSNGALVAADDYPYSGYGSASSVRDSFSEICAYYPWAEGLYYSITLPSSDDGSELHVVTGKINKAGGRLPNITPCVVQGGWSDQTFSIKPDHTSSNGIWSYSMHYCSVLPLRYVEKVTAQPPYSLIAEIHKIDNDAMDETVYATECARVPDNSGHTYADTAFGKSVIDLAKYDFEGYAIIGIIPKITQSFTTTRKWFRKSYMGFGLKYEEVLNSVYVQWKNGVNVQIESGINPIAYNNIRTMFEIKVPEMKASQSGKGYANWYSSTKYTYPNMEECSLMWYGGGIVGNVPMMHVTPKSFITASKNRNSRMYDCETKTGETTNLYGAVCAACAGFILGKPTGLEAYSLVNRFYDFCDYRDYDGITSLKPGDFFACGNYTTSTTDYGHVQYVTEVVTINGNVFSVNTVEEAAPFLRRAMLINYEQYAGYDTTGGLFSFRSCRYTDRYSDKIIARPKNSEYVSIRNAYGPYTFQDYPVTEIMCDRGSDSVYCIGEYIVLTVTDPSIVSFDVYIDGTYNKTIQLSECQTRQDDDGNTVVTFDELFVTQSGLVELKVGNITKESFYVAPPRTITYELNRVADQVTRFSFDKSTTDDVIVGAAYGYWDGYRVRWAYAPVTETGNAAYAEFPNTKVLYGQQRWLYGVIVIRRTPYGTYWVRVSNALNESTRAFSQLAGKL